MKINLELISLYCDPDLKSEQVLQSTKCRALIKGLKENKMSPFLIFTDAPRRYQKSINSKFAVLHKYMKFNFVKEKIMVCIKQGIYQYIKVKQQKLVDDLKINNVFCLQWDHMELINNNRNKQWKQCQIQNKKKNQKQRNYVNQKNNQHSKIVMSFQVIHKEYINPVQNSVDMTNPMAQHYYKENSQLDRIFCSKDVDFKVNEQVVFGKTPLVIDNPERVKKLDEKFKKDKFQTAVPIKAGKASVFASSRVGIKIDFEI